MSSILNANRADLAIEALLKDENPGPTRRAIKLLRVYRRDGTDANRLAAQAALSACDEQTRIVLRQLGVPA